MDAEPPTDTPPGANKPITAQCPNPCCRRPLRVAARFGGLEVTCLHCGSAIQVPLIAREGPIMMVRAICNVTGLAFSIQFRKLGGEGWVAERAFKREGHETDLRYEAQSLKGIYADHMYSGCPYCGDKSFFLCRICDLLNCLGSAVMTNDGQTVVCCARCGQGGALSGAIEELKGSQEQ
jgi:hypothetical protein